MKVKPFAYFILALIGQQCQAQEFWHGTNYGDSTQQVLAKIPGASKPQTSERLRSNGIAHLIDAPTELAGRNFHASLQFSSSGLEKVILIADELLSEQEANATHEVIIKAMKIRYGNLTKAADPGRSVLDDKPFWMMWSSGDTDIVVVPQHHADKLMVAYTLSDRRKEKANADAAKSYSKRINPKAVAGSL